MEKKLFLIDGYSYLYQAFYAIRGLSGPHGEPINAIYGFVNMVLSILKREKPDYIGVVFDSPEPSFRHKSFPAYKATRKPMPEELSVQLPVVKEIVTAYGFPVYSASGYEADDVIATIVRSVPEDVKVYIISRDKDLKQLLRNGVRFYDTKTATSSGLEDFEKEFGFEPTSFPDYIALCGDKSDNIPGVTGIGEKTAQEMIVKYKTLENLFEHINELPPKVARKLEGSRESVFFSRELGMVKTDAPIDFKLDDCRVREPDKEKLLSIFQRYNFKKFMEELKSNESLTAVEEKADYRLINTEDGLKRLLTLLEKIKEIAVDTETTSEDEHSCSLVGISLATRSGEGFYIPVRAPLSEKHLPKEMVLKALKPILENEDVVKYGQNLKYDYIVLRREGIEVKPLKFDTMIAAYLVDPTGRGYSLDALSLRYLGRKNIAIERLIGKGKSQLTMDLVPLKDVTPYACEDVDVVMRLKPILEKELKNLQLEKLFYEVEMPLVEVLADMQLAGVSVDGEYLRSLSKEIEKKIKTLESEIYKLAQEEFNIDSPKQLSQILYEKLGLPKVRKTKTGQMATDADVLTQLALYHRLPALVIQYRTLTKFKTTYVDALPSLIRSDGRVHTSFNQTATATGRLSSSEPNLQNIPIRDEWGQRIRRAFIPQDLERWSLLSADYSQIELRFLAHFSGDEGLRSAFENNEDIHRFVAAKIHKVSPDAVSPEMRRRAKVVNFGIIYGLSAHGLATELNISHHEAQEYIDKYFENHPRVREFIDATIRKAREDGFVRTIMGRIRYISGLDSSDRNTRALAERLAVNTVMQGSAADLIKIAMIKIHKELKRKKSNAKMVLQIHDELVFEIPDELLAEEKDLINDVMSNAMRLEVPLTVSISVGKNWAECK